ncbi:MAG: SDR family oxidoreductase [Hyphomicrobiales bacterium]
MDKSVLITGAARRIGRRIALSLAEDGWAICAHYGSSRGDADKLVDEITAAGGTAQAFGTDLSDADAPARLVETCHGAFGGLDCLINNAARFDYDEAGTMTAESWSRHMDVNLRSPLFMAQAFANGLGPERTGDIINIIDQRVWKLAPTYFTYTISKSALWTATQTMAQAFAPRIRVNAIGPGPTLPGPQQTEADFEREAGAMLLGRGTSPDEIAEAVKFILGAPAMTGQMIALDGGQHLLWRTPDIQHQGS